jgi:hypothetical protein
MKILAAALINIYTTHPKGDGRLGEKLVAKREIGG